MRTLERIEMPLELGMGGVSDNPKKTDTFVTDSDAQCTLIGSVSLGIGAQ